MLCPEVWKFSPPDTCSQEISGKIKKGRTALPSALEHFHFNHCISLVIPNCEELRSIIKSFNDDFQYYKAKDISLSDLCSKEFINNFIRRGSLTALSINTRIDTDNCVCITPTGVLVLTIDRKTYEESGLEGKVSHFSSERYIVQLNLKEDKFTSNKTQYQKTLQNLKRIQKFTLVLFWEPPDENVCPSSVAKYLNDLTYNVDVITPQFEIRANRNVKMPVISKDKDEFSSEELVEWLGMFAVDSNISGSFDSYENTYEYPEDIVTIKDLAYVEWKGLFTVHQIQRLYTSIIKHLSSFSNAPWISLYVQGFSDCPVNGNLQEHHYFTNGDNANILFLEPSGKYLLYTKSCSNKKYRK